ncbi:MAG: hypothetical protein VKJ44_04215 [Synechococcus sp.]|nr:hypothetical protein [Synechococcus sp.]
MAGSDTRHRCLLAACRHLVPAVLLVLLAVIVLPPATALAATAPAAGGLAAPPLSYRCDGDPLLAQLGNGPLDELSIPDPSTGPVPVGGFVLLQWRGLSLQLPRTNNAGAAGFTDGRWWWSLEDPAQPRLRERLGGGSVRDFRCEQTPAARP